MHSKQIAERHIYLTMKKYSKKYTRKLSKMNLPSDPDGLLIFRQNLWQDLDRERNICHSKAREYWLLRGPRLFVITVIAIGSNITYEVLLEGTFHIRSLIYGVTLLILSFYMLFMRLPDSIHASMMRVGHTHYTRWKSQLTILP